MFDIFLILCWYVWYFLNSLLIFLKFFIDIFSICYWYDMPIKYVDLLECFADLKLKNKLNMFINLFNAVLWEWKPALATSSHFNPNLLSTASKSADREVVCGVVRRCQGSSLCQSGEGRDVAGRHGTIGSEDDQLIGTPVDVVLSFLCVCNKTKARRHADYFLTSAAKRMLLTI